MECPMCSGFGALLGKLGNLFWFRCRQCGIDFNCSYHVDYEGNDND